MAAILRAHNIQTAIIRPATIPGSNELYEIVEQLPTENIKTNIIYLVPKDDPTTNDAYDKWLYVDGEWERIDSDLDSIYAYLNYLNTELLNTKDNLNTLDDRTVHLARSTKSPPAYTRSDVITFAAVPYFWIDTNKSIVYICVKRRSLTSSNKTYYENIWTKLGRNFNNSGGYGLPINSESLQASYYDRIDGGQELAAPTSSYEKGDKYQDASTNKQYICANVSYSFLWSGNNINGVTYRYDWEEVVQYSDTLAGYGIEDAYTKGEIDSMIGDIGTALDSLNADLAEV